ncbi:MAG: helix-turn-helix domain-containing protein [Verrucomicrobia bacterium]|nr:helix-turn-helix domain-containing protein [Verrucomicrobiota bacterium]
MNTKPRKAAQLVSRYPLHVRWSEADGAYLGSVPGLIGECCDAATPEGVLSQLQDIAEDLVEYLGTQGAALPESATGSHDPDPRVIRHALGLSQAGFARAMGISPKTLHKWEQGSSRPSGAARTLLRLAASDPAAVKRALAAR